MNAGNPVAAPSRPLGDEEIVRLQAEVEVDRALVAILRSLKSDPSAGALRAHMLSHVLSGRDATTALLLLGRASQDPGALARIEAKVDALSARHAGAAGGPGHGGRDLPEASVVLREPGPGARVDLFDGAGADGAARPVVPARGVASEPLRRLVMSSLGRGPGEEGAAGPAPQGEPPQARRPNARGKNHVRDGAPVSKDNALSIRVRQALGEAAEASGRPVTVDEVVRAAPPRVAEEIRGYSANYVRDVLKRSCIRIGDDLFWPVDRKLPQGLGLDDAWWEARGVPPVAHPPAAKHDVVSRYRASVEAYNDQAPAGRRMGFGKEYKVSRSSRESGGRARL